MSNKQRVVSEFGEYKIVEVVEPNIGPRRYFGEMNGQLVTKGFISIDAVRTELEMLSVRTSVQSNKWLAPQGVLVFSVANLIFYPLGKLLLLLLTLGRYPRGKHNVVFVTYFPGILLLLSFAVLAIVYQ